MECSGRLTFDAILLLIIFAFFTFSFGLIIFLIILVLVLDIFLIFVVFYVPMRVWSAKEVQHQFHNSCHLRMTARREFRRKMAVNIRQQRLEKGLAPRCAEILAHIHMSVLCRVMWPTEVMVSNPFCDKWKVTYSSSSSSSLGRDTSSSSSSCFLLRPDMPNAGCSSVNWKD
ncbi:hypothetical protein N656DRAFT_783382 [Canariomyces notabilis]|uniref:Uncharacterized protein n=1 Tax=Canariomyces notabilis TaxID=2074819 RepID=A0AAN6QHW7_9PEZI|nr:hypothetical protein N656DRAFT_783382 [Canariomyces arenarius]